MSKNGDVVWANGASWQRDNQWEGLPKHWWIAPSIDGLDGQKTLKNLKAFKDFKWVVKDGALIIWRSDPAELEIERERAKGYNEGYEDGKDDIRKEISSACQPKTWGLDINGIWVDELGKFKWSTPSWTR